MADMSNLAEQDLAQAGLPPAQAEAIAEVIEKAIHDAVDPLARKVEAAAAPHPGLEVLEERVKHTATTAELSELRGEVMTRMNELHLAAMERIGKVEGRMSKMEADLATIKWIGGVLTAAVITGFAKLIFFP